MYNNFGINENIGDSSSDYKGEKPASSLNYFDRYLIDHGRIKTGMILEPFMGSYIYQVSIGRATGIAVQLNNILGGLSHTNEFTLLSAGTKVLLYDTGNIPYIILGVLPNLDDNECNFNIENGDISLFSEVQHNILEYNSKPSDLIDIYTTKRPLDAFPGDWGIINEFGSLFGLLKGLTLIKASDLAQVQLHFFDDLVRIVSKSFEHLSSLGNDYIYTNNGFCSREVEYSISDKDRSGNSDILDSDGIIYTLDKNDGLIPQIKAHIGNIGNLIHLFGLDKGTLSDIYIGDNGRVAIKSCKEIEFRKVVSIGNPIRKHEYFKDEPYSQDNIEDFKYIDGEKELQEVEKNNWDDSKADYKHYNKENWDIENNKISDSYSYIKQREDGSIIFEDVSGSFIELDGKGNIILSCKGDIMLRSGKDLISLNGGDISLRAKENIDICSTNGDIRCKAEEAAQLYTRNKGILLETDSTNLPDNNPNEIHNYSGIKLLTNNESPISLLAGRNLNIFSKNNTVIHSAKTTRLENKALSIASQDIKTLGSQDDGEDIVSVPGTITNKININTDEFGVTANNFYQNIINELNLTSLSHIIKTTTYGLEAETVNISGSSATNIYGSGGTNVNHIHPATEMTYVPSGQGSQHVVLITKNVPPAAMPENTQIPTLPVTKTMDELMYPFTLLLIKLTKFSFRNDLYDSPFYEYNWQKLYASINWDLETKDSFQNSSPFPGFNFSKYAIYNAGENGNAGQFEEVTIKDNFKV